MWIWWYSLAINMFLWSKPLGLISTVPLILVVFFGLYDVVCKAKQYDEYSFELLLLCTAICVLLLILYINLYTFSIYLSLLVFLYMLKRGKDIFIYPPKFIRIANAVSFCSSILTYFLLYASLENEVDKGIPLIPFSINFLSECFILFQISRGTINGLTKDFCLDLAYNRALFSMSTIILFLIAILYSVNVLPENIIFSSSTILYAIALVYINRDIIRRIKCCSMLNHLKNPDINGKFDK